ncbi:uncharacterized protein LOC133869265 [Alnus glutinosa]|uniref:uncharacterized protein LOC133869265 n=1 Tax=Alnus glutinosa TaxID=3517 RepID=UPI002D76738D|nr:uncharacterized protein LOC133869265 [Alnus glutinosa]
MDKSWMRMSRGSKEHLDGIQAFLNFAFSNTNTPGFILCPCKRCRMSNSLTHEVVYDHLMTGPGILEGYTDWVLHGEKINASVNRESVSHGPVTAPTNRMPPLDGSSGMHAMLHDIFNMHDVRAEEGGSEVGAQAEAVQEDSNDFDEKTRKFFDLLKDADTPLHENTKHSKLGAIVRLYNLKCMGGFSNTIFSLLLEFINELLPTNAVLPKDTYEAKKYMRDLGLGYEKILACPNDCMLFWRDTEKLERCTSCKASKWKEDISEEEESSRTSKRKPAKVLRWFPLIPRLQRLFTSHHTAKHMKWHAHGRTKDGVLRHPADGEAWKTFDSCYPDFASDPRSVRLGLSSDGFNPFGNMSTTHSTWPVMLIPYNLPPWMCMKQPYFMLSLIISGPSSPGMKIDVYLQPLISELKELWEVGVSTFDVSVKKKFTMRAALMWTINDFPAYADLSGWSTKGKKACPCCMHSTRSTWLTYGNKQCYMGHRRWLPLDHSWRRNKRAFDGTQEMGTPPLVPSGDEIMRQLEVFGHVVGHVAEKRQRSTVADDDGIIWKKRSIFFTLPYWKDNILRHNIDVMHLEKNVLDNIICTLLDIKGKTKDNHEARKDLQKMCLRPTLHPFTNDNGKTYLPAACFTMSNDEKYQFLKVIKDVRVPDGYASNVSRCVKLKEHTIGGLKSHDSHILMQQLLPIALRGSLPKKVVEPSNLYCNSYIDT